MAKVEFTSSFLKASDIEETGTTVTFESVEQTFDKRKKEQVYEARFEEFSKPLTLNNTNLRSIIEVLGTDETSDWIGQRIVLFATQVQDPSGKQVMGIRVKLRKPGAAQGQAVAKVMSSGPFGEKGELWVIAQVAKASAENPEATLDSLRTSLAGKHPEHEAVIHTEPRNWPKSIYKSVEEWVEEAKIPF